MRAIILCFSAVLAITVIVERASADAPPESLYEYESPDANGFDPDQAVAEQAGLVLERAEGPTLARAVGHYARARSLLISALREFDRGVNIAKPDSILDAQAWRKDIAERAKDLEKLLAPQPRITKGGVKFEADRRLLKD